MTTRLPRPLVWTLAFALLLVAAWLVSSRFAYSKVSGVPEPNTLLRGTVTLDGAPVDGASISVTLWPNTHMLAQAKRGQPIPMFPVEPVKTDHDGEFAVTLHPATVSPTFWSSDGSVDVTVDAQAGKRFQTYEFTATQARQDTSAGPRLSWSTYEADQRKASQPIALDIDLGRHAGVTERPVARPAS